MNILKTSNAALILAIVYFVFPLDLIPDILGPFGRLDDLIVFGLAIWRVVKDRQQRASSKNASSAASDRENQSDPFEIFKLPRGATRAEIDARYKELAKDYHPDRVAHLGEDLRTVAHEKMIEIQQAYNTLIQLVTL